MPSIADLPSELVHVLAGFVPWGVPFLVRANRSLWKRFVNDGLAWLEAAKVVYERGPEHYNMLVKHAPSMLAAVPWLDRLFPVPLPAMVPPSIWYHAVSSDGSLLACITDNDTKFRLLNTSTWRELAVLDAEAWFGRHSQIVFTPSGSHVVCQIRPRELPSSLPRFPNNSSEQ